jgi:hypothetical protein
LAIPEKQPLEVHMARILRHAWAVLAVLLTLNIVLCAAWLIAIHANPLLAPGLFADLQPIVVFHFAAMVCAVVAVAAAVSRALVKRELETGDSARVDLLGRPAAAAALFSVALAILVLANGSQGDTAALGLAVTVAFAVIFTGLLLAALVIRRVSVKAISLALLVAAIGALSAYLLAERQGRATLQALRDEGLREVAAERARQNAAVRPRLEDPLVVGNAVDLYRPIIEAQQKTAMVPGNTLYSEVAQVLKAPGEALPASVSQAIDAARPGLTILETASRTERAVWPTEYEKGVAAPIPPLLGSRVFAQLAVADGNLMAGQGDARGAARRYLQVLRFGSDYGDASLIQALVGAAIERMAIDALAGLVRSPRGATALDLIESGLARLEPGLIDFPSAIRSERLSFAVIGPIDDGQKFSMELGATDYSAMPKFAWLIPWNANTAAGVTAMNATLRDVEALAVKNDRAAWIAFEDDFMTKYYFATPNALFRRQVPSLIRPRVSILEPRVLLQAVRAAIALERQKSAQGRYPEDPGALPNDPFAKSDQSLRYRTTDAGAGYVLYSVGVDHEDHNGSTTQDLVLPGPAWPANDAPAAKKR